MGISRGLCVTGISQGLIILFQGLCVTDNYILRLKNIMLWVNPKAYNKCYGYILRLICYGYIPRLIRYVLWV